MDDSEINRLKNLLYEITIAWANGDDLTGLMGKVMMSVCEGKQTARDAAGCQK